MKQLRLLLILVFLLAASAEEIKAQYTMDHVQLLDKRQQNIIAIATFAAKGNLAKLQGTLNTGLDEGLTINEIKEVLLHLYAYCGFPRSIRGLQTFMQVLDERQANGVEDKIGAEPTPVTDNKNKYEIGRATLEQLTGSVQSMPTTGYGAFAPGIDTFLKEHLFADIFGRGVLSFQDRELVTISVLSSIGGVEPMLKSHFKICLNIGLSKSQLQQFTDVVRLNTGDAEAENALAVLTEVLSES